MVRRVIGLAGQFSAVDDHLTGIENLQMAGRLLHLDRQLAKTHANEVSERFDLTEAANRPAKSYSGGMKRRLDLTVLDLRCLRSITTHAGMAVNRGVDQPGDPSVGSNALR